MMKTRMGLMGLSTLIACAAKPSLFDVQTESEGDSDEASSTEVDGDTTGGEATQVAWSRQLEGFGTDLELDEASQPVVAVQNPFGQSVVYRFDQDGDPLDTILLGCCKDDVAWGPALAVMESVQYGGYELHRFVDGDEDDYAHGPSHTGGWPDELTFAQDGTMRVLGDDVGDDGLFAYVDVFAADGALASTWSMAIDTQVDEIELAGEAPDGTMTVAIRSTYDFDPVSSILTVAQIDLAGATVASLRTDPVIGVRALDVLPHPDGWLAVGQSAGGVWSQLVPPDLSELDTQYVDELDIGLAVQAITTPEGFLVSAIESGSPYGWYLHRYDWTGHHLGTIPMPPVLDVVEGMGVSDMRHAQGSVYVLTYENTGDDDTPIVGFLHRVDL